MFQFYSCESEDPLSKKTWLHTRKCLIAWYQETHDNIWPGVSLFMKKKTVSTKGCFSQRRMMMFTKKESEVQGKLEALQKGQRNKDRHK